MKSPSLRPAGRAMTGYGLAEANNVIQLNRMSLSVQVRQAVWTLIATGEITAGPLYSVKWLSERLSVSATPIREALLHLSHDHVVEVHRSRGFRVPPMTEQDLDEIAEVRLLLEVPTLERIAGNVDPQLILGCRHLAEMFAEKATARDPIGYLLADQEFHLKLLSAAKNERLVEVVARLRGLTRLYGIQQVSQDGQLAAAAREHFDILDAISTGDGPTVRRIATSHLRHVRGLWAGNPEDGTAP